METNQLYYNKYCCAVRRKLTISTDWLIIPETDLYIMNTPILQSSQAGSVICRHSKVKNEFILLDIKLFIKYRRLKCSGPATFSFPTLSETLLFKLHSTDQQHSNTDSSLLARNYRHDIFICKGPKQHSVNELFFGGGGGAEQVRSPVCQSKAK